MAEGAGTDEPGCAAFVVELVAIFIAMWLAAAVVVSAGVFTLEGDWTSGDECSKATGGACIQITTAADCSWIPLMTCSEWVPLGTGDATDGE